MRIAVVGSGITGLSAAWALKDRHEVVLFEKEARLGGHSNTAAIEHTGARIDVDTGFIVYNALNYPNMIALFDHLGVATQQSDMSFSVMDGTAQGEWGSDGPAGFFAWKRNLVSVRHWQLLRDMMAFNRRAQADAASGRDLTSLTLGDYVREQGLSDSFVQRYLVPMGAAIWSTPEGQMLDYPAATFVRFFNNHRLLHVERPHWRTVTGGSRRYVERFAQELGTRVRLSSGVQQIIRDAAGVTVQAAGSVHERFDHVILACHSDEALGLLAAPSADERALLGAIRYGPNTAVLHRDPRFMPRRKAAWASWNVQKANPEAPISLTYWMNRLQAIDRSRDVFVTLNPVQPVDPALVFGTYHYAHPLFDRAAATAQRLMPSIQGVQRTWFAGAWQGYGLHEDGLRAGLRVALRLGGQVPWTFQDDDIPRVAWAGLPEASNDAVRLAAAGV
jgi:predicted NAD/FAD-binding protein